MKKLLAILIAVIIPFIGYAEADDTSASSANLGRIRDIFPDEVLATIIRDNCGRFSIDQYVTQDDLESIKFLNIDNKWEGYGKVYSLTGIGYLKNLESLSGRYCGVSELPEELRLCTHLRSLDMYCTPIETLPDWIGEFTDLVVLDVSETNISEIPETIGNLKNLKHLDIGRTKVTSLPSSIYSLQLKTLRMEGLPIK